MSKKLTTEEFIEKARKVHGDNYDYSKVEYIDARKKVCIICPFHGEFCQTPDSHLCGCGCKKCADLKLSQKYSSTTEEFIEKARQIHGDKYDYSKVEYKNNHIKVCIICPIHGEFWQTPNDHLNNKGCSKCADNTKLTTEEFIERARQIHGDKYDYSKVEYVNSHSSVCIICPIHGEFWQIPTNHLKGCDCPKCKVSKLEKEMEMFLLENGICCEEQKRFNWLKGQSLDFYIPSKNIAIECQGLQHFEPIDFGGNGVEYANKILIYTKKLDEKKRKLCFENGVKIFYYSNLHIEYPYEVYEDKEKLLLDIINL